MNWKFYKHLASPNLATIAKFDEIVKIGGCTQLVTSISKTCLPSQFIRTILANEACSMEKLWIRPPPVTQCHSHTNPTLSPNSTLFNHYITNTMFCVIPVEENICTLHLIMADFVFRQHGRIYRCKYRLKLRKAVAWASLMTLRAHRVALPWLNERNKPIKIHGILHIVKTHILHLFDIFLAIFGPYLPHQDR